MTSEFDNPAYSAYVDGEATGEERAAVERETAESTDSRRFLAALNRLSQDVAQLPRHPAPAGFSQRVMVTIERGPFVPVEAPLARSQSRARRVVPVAVSACSLLLVIGLLVSNGNRPRQSDQQTGSADSARSETPSSDFQIASNSRRGEASPESKQGNNSMPRERVRKALGDSPLGGAREPLVPPVALKGTKPFDETGKLAFVDDLRKLTRDDIGRVITALESSPAGISVVKLTVVDCRESTLDDFQVLLARSHIPREDGDEKQSSADKKPAGGKDGPQMVAVYVQSSASQLARAMAELKLDTRFRKLEVERPVAVAKLDRGIRSQIDPFLAAGGVPSIESARSRGRSARKGAGDQTAGRQRRYAPPAGNAKKGKDLKKSLSRDGTDTADDRGEPGKSIGSRVAELDRISRQLRLTIPPQLLTRGLRASQPRAGVDETVFGKKSPSAAFGADTAGPRTPGKSMRVLFVLVCDRD